MNKQFMVKFDLSYRSYRKYDPDIGWLSIPDSSFRLLSRESGKAIYFRTNSQGFRSDFDFEKSKTAQRIVFLGDSMTEGNGLEAYDRFTDILSRRFDNLEVYNYAIGSTGLDQHLLIYEKYCCESEHDVLVLTPHLGDMNRMVDTILSIDGNTGQSRIKIHKPYFELINNDLVLRNSPVPKNRQYSSRKEKSSFQKFKTKIGSFLRSKKILKRHRQGYEDWKNPNSYLYNLTKKIFERVIESAGERKVVFFPIINPYHDMNFNFQIMFKDFEERYSNVSFIDMSQELSKKPASFVKFMFFKEQPFSGLASHFSKTGHIFMADVLADFLVSERIITSPVKVGSSDAINKEIDNGYILGISAFYHDSAACLIKNGEIVSAAQEERFSRIKHDSSFPELAINYCLEEAQIHMESVDQVVFYDNPFKTLERIISSHISALPGGLDLWRKTFDKWTRIQLQIPQIISNKTGYDGPIYYCDHHVSHAASAFYPSPFKEAAILTIDGVGEWTTASISRGKGNSIKMLKSMEFPNSLGLLYSAFTYYTGFVVNRGEYKLMGLAPYGEPKYYEKIVENILVVNSDGSIKLNMEYFGFLETEVVTNSKFHDLFGGPPREPESEITQKEMDLARSIQLVTEEIVLKMANKAHEITKSDNLCMAGGVALNCVANGRILRESKFKEIWIQPAAGDAGGSLGSALYYYYSAMGHERILPSQGSLQGGSYFGPSFPEPEIKAVLDTYNLTYTKVDTKEKNRLIANLLSQGKIIGRFAGRMEFGPRALGNRTIMGDPRNVETQSKMNLRIKYRESFRPFAPTVLVDSVSKYFRLNRPSPYMLLVDKVKSERCLETKPVHDIIERVNQKRSEIPAVTHVDYSARIQTISRFDNEYYYDLIKEFENLTGCGLIVNTSFNVRGEPIVCTPYEACKCFMNTEMDVLLMEDYILHKEEQSSSTFKLTGSILSDEIAQLDSVEAVSSFKNADISFRIIEEHSRELKRMLPDSFDNSQTNSEWMPYDSNLLISEVLFFTSIEENSKHILKFFNRTSLGSESAIIKIVNLLLEESNLNYNFVKNKVMKAEDLSDTMYPLY